MIWAQTCIDVFTRLVSESLSFSRLNKSSGSLHSNFPPNFLFWTFCPNPELQTVWDVSPPKFSGPLFAWPVESVKRPFVLRSVDEPQVPVVDRVHEVDHGYYYSNQPLNSVNSTSCEFRSPRSQSQIFHFQKQSLSA